HEVALVDFAGLSIDDETYFKKIKRGARNQVDSPLRGIVCHQFERLISRRLKRARELRANGGIDRTVIGKAKTHLNRTKRFSIPRAHGKIGIRRLDTLEKGGDLAGIKPGGGVAREGYRRDLFRVARGCWRGNRCRRKVRRSGRRWRGNGASRRRGPVRSRR